MSRSPGRLRLLTGTNVANPRSTLPGFLDRITSVSTENGPLGDTAVSSEAAQGESPASAEVPGSVLLDRFKTSVTLLQAVRTRGAAIDWERFVLRYITLLKTWARRWGARHDLVDDVVQQTLLNVLRSLPAFEYDPKQSSPSAPRSSGKSCCFLEICRQLRQATTLSHDRNELVGSYSKAGMDRSTLSRVC